MRMLFCFIFGDTLYQEHGENEDRKTAIAIFKQAFFSLR